MLHCTDEMKFSFYFKYGKIMSTGPRYVEQKKMLPYCE